MEVPNLKSLPSLIKIRNILFPRTFLQYSRIILSHKFNLSAVSKYSVLSCHLKKFPFLKAVLHCAIFSSTCLARPLRHKLLKTCTV